MQLPKLLQLDKGTESGIWPDLHDNSEHLWKDGRNIEFTRNSVQKMAGWSAPLTSGIAVPIRGIGQLLDTGGQKLFYGTTTNLYRWNATGSPTTVGSGFTGNLNGTVNVPASHWSFVEWGNWELASNGVNAIQIHKTTSFSALTGTPPTKAEVILKLGPYVIAFNTDAGNTTIEWCDEDNVENWVVTSGSTAGNLVLRDFDSAIISAVYLGDRIAIYGKDRMAVLSPVSTFIFGAKAALTGIGAWSKYSVVSVGRKNYGFGPEGFYVTDGQTYNYIDDGIIRKYVLDALNKAQASKIVGFHNSSKTQIEWYYPTTTGEPDVGVAYNYITQVWSIFDHGRTAADEKRIFDYPIVATSNGNVYFKNFGVDADGAALVSYIQTRPLEMSQDGVTLEDFVKYFDMIKLKLKNLAGGGVLLKLGVQETLDEEIFYTSDLLVSDARLPLYPNLSGVYLTLRIETSAVGDNFELFGFDIHGKVIGQAN